jgi:hypothetical protein
MAPQANACGAIFMGRRRSVGSAMVSVQRVDNDRESVTDSRQKS